TMTMPCMAQDVEPPFTWEGKGSVSFISEEGGREEIDLQFELSIDDQGMFAGQASIEDRTFEIEIKHVFYTEKKQYDFPGLFSRKVVIVFPFYGNADNLFAVFNGRILMDKFFYGEAMLTVYEEGSDIAKALGVGNPYATLMEDDELPWNLRSALKKCIPLGMVKIEGDYKTPAAPANETIDLFNGENFDGWYMYKEDAWKVRGGKIYCSGKPTGFLRTKKEYSDFKLTFEWKWPKEPGNSGVLLHMSDQDKVWPLCVEAQLMNNRAGDLIGMGCKFNENKAKKDGPISYTPRMNDSNEKEPGDWNSYEIVCDDDTVELKINGQYQNKATGVSIRKGYIGFQSEGVPIMFRNIKLTPLK
ncbi:MAG: 3-keto-disaccharide hydrolase, partial [Planctomycetota bacterium]